MTGEDDEPGEVRVLAIRLKASANKGLEVAVRGVKKEHLPEKQCATCGRPFAWRKSLAKNWGEVKYCSDACRKYRRRPASRMYGRGR